MTESNSNKNWINTYKSLIPLYEDFGIKLSELLKQLLIEGGIKFHLIEHRAKSIDGFEEKLKRKESKYKNPIIDITDLTGIRIILYYIEDIDKVTRTVESEFSKDEKNSIDKRRLLSPETFGYNSVHQVVSLSKKRTHLAEWKRFEGLKAEIQIRTVLQHAWSSISHILEYKKEFEIPNQLKRKLNRLSGLLELADEEFDDLKKEENNFTNSLQIQYKSKDFDAAINLISIEQFFAFSNSLNEIIDFLNDKLEFSSSLNEHNEAIDKSTDNTMLSEIIELCRLFNISTIEDIDNLLSTNKKAIMSFYTKAYGKLFFRNFSCDFLIIILVAFYLKDTRQYEILQNITFLVKTDLDYILKNNQSLRKI